MKEILLRLKENRVVHVLLFYMTLILSSMLLGGCADQCETEYTYTYYEPIYTTLEELRSSVKQEGARELKQLGKIYYKSGYLYLNEPGEGLHVIDNRDPASPRKVSFISIPGNFSLAARADRLYVDSYVDLVVLDISDPENISESNRLESIFSDYSNYGFYIDPDKGLVTDWKEVSEITRTEADCYRDKENVIYEHATFVDGGIALANADGASTRQIANAGIGGSMATFTIISNHLYTLENQSDLITINITDANNPLVHSKQNIGWGVETLFPYGDKLFMGANDGMWIYDVSQPSSPTMLSKYEHIRSCDPVVVQGDYAYVTLRSGTACQGFSNQLEVIDISNLSSPQLLHTYPMFNPHGLGIDGDALFVCDGSAGLKIYDASDISTIGDNLKVQYGDINSLDVIPLNNVLMLIGRDGLFQYDYTNLEDIKLLSETRVNR